MYNETGCIYLANTVLDGGDSKEISGLETDECIGAVGHRISTIMKLVSFIELANQ